MWFVPRWVSATNDGPRYPLDLVIYSRRADNPLLLDPHLFLRRVGGDPGCGLAGTRLRPRFRVASGVRYYRRFP